MYKRKDIIDSAKNIRPYLTKLLNEVDAKYVDQTLAVLLQQISQGDKNENLVLELLAGYKPTREWLKKYMAHHRPPEVERLFEALPGIASPIDGLRKYVCPNGDYTWYKVRSGEPVKYCPTHNVPLVESNE